MLVLQRGYTHQLFKYYIHPRFVVFIAALENFLCKLYLCANEQAFKCYWHALSYSIAHTVS
jgi:hypothetical protein